MKIAQLGHNGGPPLRDERQGDAVVVQLPRRKGRPPKPALPPRKSERDAAHFQAVAQAISGLALNRRLWNPARQRVRSQADRDRRLRPGTAKVLGFFLDCVNRERGYDWHSSASIAADLGISYRTVETAFDELERCDYIARRSRGVAGAGKATRQWHTTIPALVNAAQEIIDERDAKTQDGPTRKEGVDPHKNAGGPTQKQQKDPHTCVGKPERENLKEESLPPPPRQSDGSRREGGRDGDDPEMKKRVAAQMARLSACIKKVPSAPEEWDL